MRVYHGLLSVINPENRFELKCPKNGIISVTTCPGIPDSHVLTKALDIFRYAIRSDIAIESYLQNKSPEKYIDINNLDLIFKSGYNEARTKIIDLIRGNLNLPSVGKVVYDYSVLYRRLSYKPVRSKSGVDKKIISLDMLKYKLLHRYYLSYYEKNPMIIGIPDIYDY